jgi:Flp pilus assembly protein TadD
MPRVVVPHAGLDVQGSSSSIADLVARAGLAGREHRFDEAASLARAAEQLASSTEEQFTPLNILGAALADASRPVEAEHALKRALSIAPDLSAATGVYRSLGKLHALHLGDNVQASKDFMERVRLTPGDADAVFDAAWASVRMGEVERSRALLERCLELRDTGSSKLNAHRYLSSVLAALGEAERSLHHFGRGYARPVGWATAAGEPSGRRPLVASLAPYVVHVPTPLPLSAAEAQEEEARGEQLRPPTYDATAPVVFDGLLPPRLLLRLQRGLRRGKPYLANYHDGDFISHYYELASAPRNLIEQLAARLVGRLPARARQSISGIEHW